MAGRSILSNVFTGVVSELLLAYSPFIVIAAIAAYVLMPEPIEDRVVLLPGPDGKVGAVFVKSQAGEKLLNTAYAGVGVAGNGELISETQAVDAIKARYGAVLTALPPRPVAYTVNFVSGSATQLDVMSGAAIGAIKLALAGRPAPEITVIGHTDTVGELEANDALSRERATTVRDLLVASGISAASMEVAGRGERELLISTPDNVDEPMNRRVEINVR